MLYDIMDWQRRTLAATFNPVAQAYVAGANLFRIFNLPAQANSCLATAEILGRIGRLNNKPSFNLPSTRIGLKDVAVQEEVLVEKSFGNLLHFKRDTKRNDPKVLLVAPMSGHYATLLRKTVEDLLPNHDVYVTDWKNPRDIPRSEGDFSLEDYIDYVRDFIKTIGPGVHIAGHSQSTIPVLAVTAFLAAEKSPFQPVSMTLAGGPIDARINPTAVDKFALKKSINWFRDHLIHKVATPFAGRGREVYPGLLQLMNLVSVSPQTHAKTYSQLHKLMSDGNIAEATKIRDSRDEFENVFDMSATYYLDTLREVFQKFSLPRGEMTWKGRKVDPSAIRKTALLTLEGEKDDICAPGQTLVAHTLCRNIPRNLHFANIEKGAGHYELLDGNRIAGFIRAVAAEKGILYDAPVTGNAIAPKRLHPEQVKAYLGNSEAANDAYKKGPKLDRA